MTKHFPALAISTLVVLASIGLEAQRPFNDRDLEKMGMRQWPMPPDDEEERAIVAYVRKTPAENLDAALPPLELEAWLAGTLLAYNPHPTPVEWRLERCEDFTTDFPDYSAELCVVAKSENISPSAEKSLTLILAVGGWSQSGDEGRWVIQPPAIRDLFLQNAANSLDVRSLSTSRRRLIFRPSAGQQWNSSWRSMPRLFVRYPETPSSSKSKSATPGSATRRGQK